MLAGNLDGDRFGTHSVASPVDGQPTFETRVKPRSGQSHLSTPSTGHFTFFPHNRQTSSKSIRDCVCADFPWDIFMAQRPAIHFSDGYAPRGLALAERRLAYLAELYDSGRWRRFHGDADFLLMVRDAQTAVKSGAGSFAPRPPIRGSPLRRSWSRMRRRRWRRWPPASPAMQNRAGHPRTLTLPPTARSTGACPARGCRRWRFQRTVLPPRAI